MTPSRFGAMLAMALTSPAFGGPREDAVIACHIGQAAVGLHRNIGSKMNANAAAEAALHYADRRCRGGSLIGESGNDFVSQSVLAMARKWFLEDQR